MEVEEVCKINAMYLCMQANLSTLGSLFAHLCWTNSLMKQHWKIEDKMLKDENTGFCEIKYGTIFAGKSPQENHMKKPTLLIRTLEEDSTRVD